jgi:hypothetical protein
MSLFGSIFFALMYTYCERNCLMAAHVVAGVVGASWKIQRHLIRCTSPLNEFVTFSEKLVMA